MEKASKNVKIIFIKDHKVGNFQETKQTKSLRDQTNKKIRELGGKYYDVKNKLDKLKVHRDILFSLGKELESELKNENKKIHLQTQYKRMKESLIVWFTEYFYDELLMPNSPIIERLLVLEKLNILKNIQSQSVKIKSKPLNKDHKTKKDLGNDDSLITDIKLNVEIDDFQFSNAERFDDNHQSSSNKEHSASNFDFNKYFNFE